MLNLVQIQEKLKDMPMQAVAAYANGSNPMVPPYVALGELNRRKQMEQAAVAEQAKAGGEQPTVKDQMEQQLGLMNLQQQRQAQGAQQMGQAMANNPNIPAQAPVQMAGGGIVPSQLHRQEMRPRGEVSRGVPEERGISGNDLKKMMMLAALKKKANGIANLPMKRDMLSKRDFACGGIVAFQQGGETEQEARDFDQATALFEAERAAKNAQSEKNEKISTGDLLRKLVEKASKEQTMEDLAAQQKRARELAGVSEDPYAESRKSRDEIIAERRAYAGNQPRREFMETLLGIAGTKPGQGLGMALGEGAKAQLKEEERFRALNDQQKIQEMQWQRADEKEKDAYARGDAKAILEAQQEKDKLNYNIAKLSTERDSLAYQKFMMAVNGDPYLKQLEERRKKAYVEPGSPEDLEFDRMMNARKEQLAKEAGYDYKTVPYVNPVTPKPKEKKKGLFSGILGGDEDKKEGSSKAQYDTGIPPELPKGTKVFGRTPSGEVVYLTPDGKKVTKQ